MAQTARIKVLHLVTRMNVGGVAVLLDNLSSNWDQSEFEVILATGECELPESEYPLVQDAAYSIHRIPNFHKSLKIKDDFLAFLSIVRLIRTFRPDIIHTHTSKAGLFGRLAAVCFAPSAKRVHTFHGHLLVGYFSRIKLTIVISIEKVLAWLSDGLIAMGRQVKYDLLQAGIGSDKKFRVLFPGLYSPESYDRAETRKRIGLAEDKLFCIFVGRLTQVKRIDRILDVAFLTKFEIPNLEYLIIGDGELSAPLMKQAELRELPIRFLGWRTDIADLLAASDISILTSDNEAVALTLIEAAQAGLPIVTTPAGAVQDVAINGTNAIVSSFEIADISNAVIQLAKDSALRKRMGDQGKLIAESKFSIQTMVQGHQNYYKELLR
jgi:glycosyltransferase involved in cell wall biosynthesis